MSEFDVVVVHIVTVGKYPDSRSIWGVFLSRQAAEDAVRRAGPEQIGTDWEIERWPAEG
jgi:hypothetical protein